jgi:membrane peptidoglycan carboxypeptidase
LLAGVTQAPSLYDPTVDPKLAAVRRASVLAAMVDHQIISADQAAIANAEPVLTQGAPPATCPG